MNTGACGAAAVVIAAGIGLTGCASTGATTAATDGPARSLPMQDDMAYVARIERQARARGIQVIWVNKPWVAPTPR